MKRLIVGAALLLALGAAPASAQMSLFTGGDSTLTAGQSFKIYPLFTAGGGHIHSPQWVGAANGYGQANGGFIFSSAATIRVNLYGPAGVDTTGFTIPAGGNFASVPKCDSILVLHTGTINTRVTWGLHR